MVSAADRISPAEKAGLREGDVVVSYDGMAAAGIDDVHRLLTGNRVGQETQIVVLRRGEKLVRPIVATELIRQIAKPLFSPAAR